MVLKKKITCLLPQGKGHGLMERVFDSYGELSVQMHNGRGQNHGMKGRDWREVDIVTIRIDASDCEALFQWLYTYLDIANQSGSFIYVQSLEACSDFSLPEERKVIQAVSD